MKIVVEIILLKNIQFYLLILIRHFMQIKGYKMKRAMSKSF